MTESLNFVVINCMLYLQRIGGIVACIQDNITMPSHDITFDEIEALSWFNIKTEADMLVSSNSNSNLEANSSTGTSNSKVSSQMGFTVLYWTWNGKTAFSTPVRYTT